MKDKKELFQSIETILNYMVEYKRTQVIDFSKNPSDIDLFRKVMKHVYPTMQPEFNCSSCVVNLMHHLQAYYEREYPKYLKANPVIEQEAKVVKEPEPVKVSEPVKEEIPVEVVSKEVQPVPKPKTSRKKNKK